jgi:hypothetical protein
LAQLDLPEYERCGQKRKERRRGPVGASLVTRPARTPWTATSMASVFRLLGHSHWRDPELVRLADSLRSDPGLVAALEQAYEDEGAWKQLVELAEANGSDGFSLLDLTVETLNPNAFAAKRRSLGAK